MSDSKLQTFGDVANVAKKKKIPPNAGKGRPKGSKNVATKALKDMILGALSDVGGQEYLVEQAHSNPGAFMGLIAKVLPIELQNKHEGGITITVATGIERADG